ncbi:MAG: hypothetical protein ACE5L7_12570, partial [Candidatus Aminicenantales bacterium]
MKRFIAFFSAVSLIFMIFPLASLCAGEQAVDKETLQKVKSTLLEKYGEAQKFRIDRGVEQVASLWKTEDGSPEDFSRFCQQYFIADPELLDLNFQRLETHYEVLNGHFNKMILDLKRPLHLDWGKILPLDMMFGQFDPSAHLSEDLFRNKIAFFVLLNFPHYTLSEKSELGPKWSRKEWAYARMGDLFLSRVPARIYQEISKIFTEADTYISEYNIFMGRLVDEKMKTYFPEDLKLISHWGLRDELKARYSDPDGLFKQKMIYEVMLRIIRQEIPRLVINSPRYFWNPFTNKVYEDGKEVCAEPEPNTRYSHFLQTFRGMKKLDPYWPALPTHIKRKFEKDREIPEEEVEALFRSFLSSPQVRKVGKLISQRLRRKLEPFDIWYPGFKSGGGIPEEELDRIVAEIYTDIDAFEKDIPNILMKLGFSREQADFIAP